MTTASSTVPALSSAITTSLDWTVDTVPRVAVLGTTTEIAVATVLVLIAPEVKGVALKFSIVGFRVTVNALVATEAVMGWIGITPPTRPPDPPELVTKGTGSVQPKVPSKTIARLVPYTEVIVCHAEPE